MIRPKNSKNKRVSRYHQILKFSKNSQKLILKENFNLIFIIIIMERMINGNHNGMYDLDFIDYNNNWDIDDDIEDFDDF